ncbi:MAG: hypothetical protein H7317_07220 [Pseudorhodobacter sp.]|nr:hypothetical protein [Pseudorhodobacter sp.]
MELAEADPKGLVRESYQIEGITAGECRSIFLDWALSVDKGQDVPTAIERLIAEYVGSNPGHPMNEVLAQGLGAAEPPRRRGGRMGRV